MLPRPSQPSAAIDSNFERAAEESCKAAHVTVNNGDENVQVACDVTIIERCASASLPLRFLHSHYHILTPLRHKYDNKDLTIDHRRRRMINDRRRSALSSVVGYHDVFRHDQHSPLSALSWRSAVIMVR